MRQGELDLVYQPQVDLRTGHIAAVEALVRWHRPDRRVILPSEFIPLAESSGTIGELTDHVLDTALSQAARWTSARWDRAALPIWVNISAAELDDASRVDRIQRLIENAGVRPQQLGFEVTESAPIADLGRAVESLQQLRGLGARIALDDFGTGYSSLSHLRSLPADVVKIDGSFVQGITQSDADVAIVRAVVEMAQATRRVVVAEGVEDRAQQEALDQLGCDLGQGYLFSSPQPPHCVDILLDADRQLASRPARRLQPTVRLPRPRAVSGQRGEAAIELEVRPQA